MALPSSAPSLNQLSVFSAAPDRATPLAPLYIPTSEDMRNDFRNNLKDANTLTDQIVLRPAQLQAAQSAAALSDAQNHSGLRLVPAEEAAKEKSFAAQGDVSSLASESAKAQQEELLNPGRALRVAEAQVVAINDDYQKARQSVIEAHATGDNQAVETAEKKAAKLAGDLDIYKSRYARLIADTTAAEHNAKTAANAAQTESATSASTLSDAQKLAETQGYSREVARIKAEEEAIRAGDFKAHDARVAAGTNADIIAGGQSGVAAAPYVSEPVIQSLEEGARASAVAAGLTQKAGLLALVQQIATGSFTGAVTPAQDQSIREEAVKAGVPVLLPNGAKRPLGEVSQELSTATNVKNAEKEVTAIRETAAANQSALTALQQIKGLGDVNTGALYTIPGVANLDRVFAQFGADQSQRREMYSALNQRLVPLVRQPGSVSNFEQQLYIKALPGPGLSEKSNGAMLKGLLAVGERNAARPAFYDALLGPLPVSEVNKLWGQYVDQNPTILDVEANPNEHAITPGEYVKFLTADPKTADSLVRNLAQKADVATLRPGSTAADLEAAPATDPFLAAPGARGESIPVPNPKYWNPVVQAAATVRKKNAASAPAAASQTFMNALNAPAEDFIRPARSQSTIAPPPLDMLAPRR